MFHSLSYDVTFAETGRRLHNDLAFEPGYWAITGDNESGKTFILEMLRYALFGSAALRGSADTYASLDMHCVFTIKDETYVVRRSLRRASLGRGGEVICTGVSAVNAKVVEILGYGLAVFDVAHSINQGEVERLGSMTPAERKRLVDNVLGIDALDIVARWAMDEARTLDATAAGLRAGLVDPVEPIRPENYRPTSEIDLPALRSDAEELVRVEAFLAHPRAAPVEPTTDAYDPGDKAAERGALRQTVEELKAKVAALPETAPYTEEQLDEAEKSWALYHAHQEAQRWLQRNPQPEMALDTALGAIRAHEQLEAHRVAELKRIQIEEALERAREAGACTNCGHPFEHDHIAELEAELAAHVVPKKPLCGASCTRTQAERAVRDWETFDQAKHLQMSQVFSAPRPTIPEERIALHRAQIAQAAERACLYTKYRILSDRLTNMPDYELIQLRWIAHCEALAAYEEQLTSYQEWVAAKMEMEAHHERLAGARERLAAAEAEYQAARDFELAHTRFEEEMKRYVERAERAEALAADAARHRKVRDLMNVLRSLIKQHLMPSLNKVASHLLAKMTGGQRTSIVVDEDFKVMVDRQSLETLSGSGKACANLAIRIALGQVLTNRVMSVLLADEIDASMDSFRAEQTSNTLWMLKDSISQILNVSHKQTEAPNQISLGEFSERPDSAFHGAAA